MQDQKHGTTELPTHELTQMVRQQCRLDATIRTHAPEGVELDQWTLLDEASVEDIRWEDGDLHVWMEGETHVQERIARATRHQPAEYRNHYPPVLISITWSLDPEDQPIVDMEVELP